MSGTARYFEVLRRDGPARLGKLGLGRTVQTPALLERGDYITAGSVLSFGSVEEAIRSFEELPRDDRLLFAPHIPGTLHHKISIRIPDIEPAGKIGFVVHPFEKEVTPGAQVYVMGGAGCISNPRDTVNAFIKTRELVPPDAALFAPAIATPSNLALLAYMGVDLVDTVRVEIDGYYRRFHSIDGVTDVSSFKEIPCKCPYCQVISTRLGETSSNETNEAAKNCHNTFSSNRPANHTDGYDEEAFRLECRNDYESKSLEELIAGHNKTKLEEEIIHVREMIRKEELREYVEKQVRTNPGLTAMLRLLDEEGEFLERRTPTFRHSILYANTSESLKRIEVTRFARRVIERYTAPQSDVLLLLPCSAKKPYSKSRSHRLFAEAIGGYRRFLHEVILTSPLAIVPRELEEMYPASSYDVPVTGRWDLEERDWLTRCLDAYLERNRYKKIVAHLDGELCEAVKDHGIDAVYTGGGTSKEGLSRLSVAVSEACQNSAKLGDPRLRTFKARVDFCFGLGAGDALLDGRVKIKGHQVYDADGRALVGETINGTIVLTLAGARRLLPRGDYIVHIADFMPKGTILAPGVVFADDNIRPGDEVMVSGERAFGVGRARMSGWEMTKSKRGVAVDLRLVEAVTS